MALFLLKWTLVAALPLLAIWGVFRLISQPEQVDTRNEPAATSTSPTPEATISPEAPPPTTASPTSTPPASPSPTPAKKGRVQVLNGTAKEGLAQKAADRLKADGYEIAAVARASRSYEKTTVFYQPGQKAMADQIARFLGATEVSPAPDNLDKDIPVTVVVGNDFKA